MNVQMLLSRMTLTEKLGQLVQYPAQLFLDSESVVTGPLKEAGWDQLSLATVGSVLNFNGAADMCRLQREHLAQDRHVIPMLFMMDVIHGYRTIYPIPLALGCSFDTELVEECSKMAAKEAAAGGVHVTFTPMVDLVRDARWGRVMETGGEDPFLNALMGAVQVCAFQGTDLRDPETLAACVKHFAAYGGVEAGRDYNTVELSEHTLRDYYLPAYKACIDAGVAMLMTSFSALNGTPAVANPWLMKTILQDEWGYDGVVISDYDALEELCVHGVAQDMRQAARLGMQNRCDIDMCSHAYDAWLADALEDGSVTPEQIDRAVLRVLRLKERLGLFEDPYRGASPEREERVCAMPEHRALARKAAAECAVLLKNDGVLPFSADVKRVALIGPFADEHAILGAWACHGREEDSVTVADGMRARLPQAQIAVARGCSAHHGDDDRSGFAQAIEAASAAEIVVLCLGEPSQDSGEGHSRAGLDLPGLQTELAREIVRVNPHTAVVLFNGRPLALTQLSSIVPAMLDMWFPGTEGGRAVADVLFGDVNPAGKLTMSFPKTVGQCPIYYNHPHTGRPVTHEQDGTFIPFRSNYIDCGNLPLYSFGYGLSYSRFVYREMTLSARRMTADGAIEAAVTLTNDSEVAGKETVQLYLRDMVASTIRPVAQLAAFKKVFLAPHETKTVTFTINEPMLRYWHDGQGFSSDAGEFAVSTGYADHLLFTTSFWLKDRCTGDEI